MTPFLADLQSGWRALRARPGLTAVVIVTLVLGIGANGAVFSTLEAVLLRPLGYAAPDRLVMVWETDRRATGLEMTSLSGYLDVRSGGGSFESMAAWGRPLALALTSATPAREVTGCQVTATFFPTLGVAPAAGRAFLPEEETPGKDRVAVISHALRRSLFGGSDPIGAALTIDATPFRIVGVMPAEFRSPSGPADVWLPLSLRPNDIDRGQNYLHVVARLRPDIALEQAQAEMDALASALERRHPRTNSGIGIRLVPLTDQVVGGARPLLWIAFGAIGFVFLVVGANVAGLQLVKAADRAKEIAVRVALGAPRARIARLLLIESLIPALLGGAGGVLLALAGQRLLLRLAGDHLPRADEVHLNGIAIAFMLVLSLALGIATGLAPVLHLATGSVDALLRGGGRHTGDVRHRRWGQGFAVAQVAIALVLLVGGGLLVRSFARLRSVPPGFDPQDVLVARLSLGAGYDEAWRRTAYLERLTERLKAVPGVRDVGASTVLPMNPFGIDFDVPYYLPETPEPDRASAPQARFRSATPGYFEAMGIAVLAGRVFDDRDAPDAPLVVMVNRTLARRIRPDGNPIGHRLRFFWADWQTYEIVGVVDDTRSYGLAAGPRAELFVPYAQNPYRVMNVVVRFAGDATQAAGAIRSAFPEIDPLQPIGMLTTMNDLLSGSTARERIAAALVSILALLALMLALTGVHGVVAWSASRRTREIGLRIALGARRARIMRMVLGGSARMAALGLALGLPAAWVLGRALSGQLFGIRPDDPLIFLVVPALLLVATTLAGYAPARRAAALPPTEALRQED